MTGLNDDMYSVDSSFRDLAYFMPKEIDRQFAPDAAVSMEPGLCERRLQGRQDCIIHANKSI